MFPKKSLVVYFTVFACHLIFGGSNEASEGRLFPGFISLPEDLFVVELLVTTPLRLDFGSIGLGRKKRETMSLRDGAADLLDARLAKLESILIALGVDEQECFEAVICTLHERPTIFGPLLELLKNLLDPGWMPVKMNISEANYSWTEQLYERYVETTSQGRTLTWTSTLGSVLPVAQCEHLAKRILENPAFTLLQFITNFASVNIR